MENLKWAAFKQQLQANPHLALQFQYAHDQWVKPSYHITEIKQVPITSVDCGGVTNKWTEVIVQLYEPQAQQDRAMEVSKALAIIEVVEKTMAIDTGAIVKIEFGNAEFDTRQMLPKSIATCGDDLVVDLRPDTVQCKAIERGGNCGTDSRGEGSSDTAATTKPIIKLQNLAAETSCCTPGGGCC